MGTLAASWTVEIEAPIERVWAVAADVPASPAWQPALETVEAIETDGQGRATLVDTSSHAVVKTTRQQLRFEFDEPTGMSWVQIKGDVKSLTGWWEFTALGGDRTEATFALVVDPGRVLGMLLRGPVEGRVKEFLTKGAAEGLKQHVESPGSG